MKNILDHEVEKVVVSNRLVGFPIQLPVKLIIRSFGKLIEDLSLTLQPHKKKKKKKIYGWMDLFFFDNKLY